ncbi:MAG: hypothetical protein QGF46_01870, partial [Planctomycetota bacterium]|nr:hypothetical protein [Planctomycetota bacterium]
MPPICYLTAQSHALKEVTSDLFKKHPLADFSKLIFVSSNSRSNRLLEQLILQEVDRKQLWQDFKAPKFARLGSLPEIILDYDDSNIASPAACHLAWINALSTVNPSEAKINLGVNIKSPSETLILSELLAQFILRLESEQMCCKVMGLEHADNETESKRMLFLHSLYIKYLEFLEQAGLSDKHQLRRLALDQAKVKLEDDLRIVLVCIPELSKFQKSLLSNCDEQLDIYQFKFPHLQSPYDEFGCVIPDKFISNECVPLNNTNVVFAENPREMVKKAINAIQHSSNKIAPEDISFSVLEKDCEPLLSEELSKFELNLRSAVGIELSRSLVVQLLQDLHNYLADPSFNNAKALLNHPDLCFAPELTKNLNLHQQQHLPTQLPGAFINKLPKIVSQNTTGLHQGITAVQSFLSEVYGDLKINPEQSDDSHLQARALQTVDALIDELLQIAPLLSEDPKLRFNLRRCIAFLLHQCKNKFLPPRHIENSVENLDWLELNLDPATYKVIIGFNENYVPGKFSNIPFVSNEMALKCEFYSERQRLARDSFTLQSLVAVNSKDDSNLHLIVGHSNNEGSILLPPRLLFLGDTEKSYSNIEKYSAEQVPPLSSPAPPPQTRALPTSNHGTPERVSVTAVNTFLRSPYSFYLNYILKLKSPQSDCNEL